MPISKIPVGAIQSGTIGTSQIADNAVTTAKILNDNVTSAKIPNSAVGSTEIASDAVTGDKIGTDTIKTVNADSIMLNSTNGTADAGDFLVLDGTDNSSTNANDRILYDETFNPATFNINGKFCFDLIISQIQQKLTITSSVSTSFLSVKSS